MSAFGDEKYHMNDLYDELNRFVNEGGTLAELFEVLRYFFSDYDTKLKELEELEKTMTITTDDKPILIHDWKELLALPPNDKYKIVDIDGHGYNAWIMPIEETKETEKNWGKHHVYLSTHTFYGRTYEHSTRLLQEHGFNVEIDNWDKEEK